VVISIRPEKIRVLNSNAPSSPQMNHLSATIIENTFLGEASEHLVKIGERSLKITSSPPILAAVGEAGRSLALEIDPADCIVLPE
jgi:ABC-type Fe3+/spermidine/putrescine transport system ATPase subunit